LTAAILPPVAMLALLAGGALGAVATEHRRDSGDTLAVETAQAGIAIAGGLALLSAAITLTVAVLALLPDRAAVGLTTEDRCEAGDATLVVARQPG
jgi:hypothetical protein